MKRFLFAAMMMVAANTAHANATSDDMTFHVDAKDGYMNMRTGPGTKHRVLGSIPNGETITTDRCVPRDDGMRGPNWCFFTWNGMRGWVSKLGLVPAGDC
jgi:uncharacterized protein YraI